MCGYLCVAMLLLAHHVLGQHSNTIQIISFRHESNPAFIKEVSLKLMDYNHRQVINGSVVFSRDIDEFDLSYTALVPKSKGRPLTLVNVTTDGCRFLQGGPVKSLNLLYMILQKIRATNPSIPKKCPLARNKEIYILNFYLDSGLSVPNLPEVKIDVIIGLRRKGVDIYKSFLSMEVSSRQGKRTIGWG